MAINYNVGNLIGKDAVIRRKMWKEAASMFGTPGCKYYSFKENTRTFTNYGEVRGEYKDPIEIPIILLTQIEQETALQRGWITEVEDSSVSRRAQLPYDTPDLVVGCKLAIPYFGNEGDETPQGGTNYEMFRITAIYNIPRYPESRVVDLAVDQENSAKIFINKQLNPDNNYHFLNVNQND